MDMTDLIENEILQTLESTISRKPGFTYIFKVKLQ